MDKNLSEYWADHGQCATETKKRWKCVAFQQDEVTGISGGPGSLLPQLAPSVRTCREEGVRQEILNNLYNHMCAHHHMHMIHFTCSFEAPEKAQQQVCSLMIPAF